MTKREFGNFSQWSLKELIEAERSFTVGDRRGDEIRAEIDRRIAAKERLARPINLVFGLLAALAAIVTIGLGVNRGIYVGSITETETHTDPPIGGVSRTVTTSHMVCRHLFITGIAELPALGGFKDMPGYAVDESPRRPLPSASALHCRLFAS